MKRTPLSRGSRPLKRKKAMRKVSAKKRLEAAELTAIKLWLIAQIGPRCERCRKRDHRFDLHHLVPRSRGGKNTIENVRLLCRACHDALHFAPECKDREKWIRSRKR